MNIIGGNITLVIDPLEKAIGYREALIVFWPVLAAVGTRIHLLAKWSLGHLFYIHFQAESVSWLQAFRQKTSLQKIIVTKGQQRYTI